MTLNSDEINDLKQIICTFSTNLGVDVICLLPYMRKGKDIVFEIDIVYNKNESYKDRLLYDSGLLDIPDFDELDDMVSEYIQMYSKSAIDFEKLCSDIYYEGNVLTDKSLVSSYILFDRFGTFEKLKENLIGNVITSFDNILSINNVHELSDNNLTLEKHG